MKHIRLFLSSSFLFGCMLLAQQPQTPSQPPPLSTPPTFPQGESQPRPESMPPDTHAPSPEKAPAHSTASAPTTVEGCLSAAGGTYLLTDSSGNSIQLQGDTSQFQKHLGERVRITGTATSPASTATDQESSTDISGGTSSFSVDSLKTIAKTCAPSQSVPK